MWFFFKNRSTFIFEKFKHCSLFCLKFKSGKNINPGHHYPEIYFSHEKFISDDVFSLNDTCGVENFQFSNICLDLTFLKTAWPSFCVFFLKIIFLYRQQMFVRKFIMVVFYKIETKMYVKQIFRLLDCQRTFFNNFEMNCQQQLTGRKL